MKENATENNITTNDNKDDIPAVKKDKGKQIADDGDDNDAKGMK